MAGDVLALDLPNGPALFRVLRVDSNRLGELPLLEELEYDGPGVPPEEIIQQLPARDVSGRILWPKTPFWATDYTYDPGWMKAGFRKIARIPVGCGDDAAEVSNQQMMWGYLAEALHEEIAK